MRSESVRDAALEAPYGMDAPAMHRHAERTMGMPRGARTTAKVRKPARRGAAVLSAAMASARRAAPHQRPAPAVRAEWSSFVARCVRSWVAAGASASAFLTHWRPLNLPVAAPPRRRDRAQRRATTVRRKALRGAYRSAPVAAPARWAGPLAAAGGAEALRARYPFVHALLHELGSIELDSASPRQRRLRKA
jgi:hypothetical protein